MKPRIPAGPGLALLLGGLAMFGPFSIDAMFPAFPAMGADLGADKLAMQQTVSVYLIAYAVMSLVHGPLSDAWGRRNVILGGLAVFILATIGCALSTSMGVLLMFRALQGLSAGVGYVVARAVIRDVRQGADAQRLMSQVSMIFGIAPAIAPVVGGWIVGWSGWQMIFWCLAGFSALLLLAVAAWLPETHPRELRLPLSGRRLARDYLGIASNRRFIRLALAGSLPMGGLFLYIASAPAVILDLLRLDEQQFAWLFLPTIGGMVFGAFLSGRAAGRIDGRRLATFGFLLSVMAAACNLVYNLWAGEGITVPWAMVPLFFYSAGLGLVFPILTLAILDMYPRQRGATSSLQAFSNLTCNAIVAGVLSPLLSHSGTHLSVAMLVFLLGGWALWTWELRSSRHIPPPSNDPAGLEQTEHL